MTLVAINQEMDLFCPYRDVERMKGTGQLSRIYRDLQKKHELFCCGCYKRTGQLYPVRYRFTENKKPHFFHVGDESKRDRKCGKSGVSEKHEIAIQAIAGRLEAMGMKDIKLNSRLMAKPDQKWRRPDISVKNLGAIECHEVQLSKITSDQLAERTQDLFNHGAATVHWYFNRSNLTEENRQWGADTDGVFIYRLGFDRETEQPTWRIDDPVEPRKIIRTKRSSSVQANCLYSGQGGSPHEVYKPSYANRPDLTPEAVKAGVEANNAKPKQMLLTPHGVAEEAHRKRGYVTYYPVGRFYDAAQQMPVVNFAPIEYTQVIHDGDEIPEGARLKKPFPAKRLDFKLDQPFDFDSVTDLYQKGDWVEVDSRLAEVIASPEKDVSRFWQVRFEDGSSQYVWEASELRPVTQKLKVASI